MRRLGRKLASFLWWTYPRGSLEYDIMVGVILAFIFLTPARLFHDQPRPSSPPPALHSTRLHPPRVAPPAGAALPPLPHGRETTFGHAERPADARRQDRRDALATPGAMPGRRASRAAVL